ncbi:MULTISPECIES: ATP-binding protein [Streptomyces]|uniref:ATP-binding protein n=1 Tax=Streptomyces TaxID=1883 RepID=UPI000DA63D7B|nr:ATP-binding protein [Streptomyces sp. SID7805]MYU54583.1 hypothetical protein [Streptomyces sp. SID7805]
MPTLVKAVHDALEHSPAAPHAWGLLSLPGDALASAGAARRFVRAMARSCGLPTDMAEPLEMITGELAANALEHSESRSVTVVFFRTARTATVSVTDEGHGCASVPDLPGAEQENGRGLLIIDTLAGRWGQRKTDGGFTVWAEIAVRSAPGPAGQPTGPAK